MDTRSFSIEEALSFGWSNVKSNFGFFVALAAISVGIIFVLNMIGTQAGNASGLISLVAYVVQIVLEINWIRISLKFVDGGERPTINDLFAFDGQLFINMLIASIVAGIGIMIGLFLLIIPGIFLATRWAFYSLLVVDQHAGPIQSIQQSWALTSGHAMQIFLLGLVLVIINVLGTIPLGLGLLATIPISALAGAFVYRRLASVGPSAYTPA